MQQLCLASGALLMLLLPCGARAQRPTPAMYGIGSWEADSLGNHRVVLHVRERADAVLAVIPWRRRDQNPELKNIVIIDATTGTRIANARWVTVSRERGNVVFQPLTAPGDYYVYYLLYRARGSSNYPRGYYQSPEPTASREWLERIGDDKAAYRTFPRAHVVQFQSIDQFNSVFPMEVIATPAEVDALLHKQKDKDYLLFPEDRSHPIRMTTDLPYHWAANGPASKFSAEAQPGEFFVFQIGAFAARSDLTINAVCMYGGDLEVRDDRDRTGYSPQFSCFNTSGRNWRGEVFTKPVSVQKGTVQPLWCGIQIPENTRSGWYREWVTVVPKDLPSQSIEVELHVAGSTIEAGGDNVPERLSRLRWLNSTLAQDDSLIKPFTPVTRTHDLLSILGRSVKIGASGLPTDIWSSFTPEVTRTDGPLRNMLNAPVSLDIVDTAGRVIPWQTAAINFTTDGPGAISWRTRNLTGDFDVAVNGRLECDGFADFQVVLTARRSTHLGDVRLHIPFDSAVARYVMGLGTKGGYRPHSLDWKWNQKYNQDALWVGDVNAGLQCSLRDTNYERPLNTNFYLSKPLNLPSSWYNGGNGGIRLSGTDDNTVSLIAYSGKRLVGAGEQVHFFFSFLITPFKTLRTDEQWNTRFFHKFAPLDAITAKGANTINVHHATPVNPFINYPFLHPAGMRAYVDSAHARNCRVKIYYTVRELSNRAPELFMLRSLGDEILSFGPGGGFSWLQEHLDTNYIAAWFVPELKDAALINSGVSRWHNYYVEGLDWLVRNVGIDGLYIDDVAFDRTTMKRVRKTLDRHRPAALIDLHSANQYNPRDGFASSANLYLEHFPYIDRLWFGEYFDYDARPEYWLIEISGIPFGVMGEMLEKGGNPWRGMVYGMTSRLPWAGDPTQLWKAWDEFGMQGSHMFGYWTPENPVRTDRQEVLATAFVKQGKTLVALASWENNPVSCRLIIDWKKLGLNPDRTTVTAPVIDGFQPGRVFTISEPIPVEPGKGWLLVLQ
jgi:hypothetical protein